MEDLISYWEMIGIYLGKGLFTRLKKRTSLAHNVAHLDHFLVQSDLLLSNHSLPSNIFPWVASYHWPIILLIEYFPNYSPLPFRVNPLLLQNNKVLEMISREWGKWILGSPIFTWERKLKVVKLVLKKLSKNKY